MLVEWDIMGLGSILQYLYHFHSHAKLTGSHHGAVRFQSMDVSRSCLVWVVQPSVSTQAASVDATSSSVGIHIPSVIHENHHLAADDHKSEYHLSHGTGDSKVSIQNALRKLTLRSAHVQAFPSWELCRQHSSTYDIVLSVSSPQDLQNICRDHSIVGAKISVSILSKKNHQDLWVRFTTRSNLGLGYFSTEVPLTIPEDKNSSSKSLCTLLSLQSKWKPPKKTTPTSSSTILYQSAVFPIRFLRMLLRPCHAVGSYRSAQLHFKAGSPLLVTLDNHDAPQEWRILGYICPVPDLKLDDAWPALSNKIKDIYAKEEE